MRRDDSSIDSLECSPPPRKDKISLSRDSGLTMSDSQLYTPDEEESGSTSSSGYDPAFDNHAKVRILAYYQVLMVDYSFDRFWLNCFYFKFSR